MLKALPQQWKPKRQTQKGTSKNKGLYLRSTMICTIDLVVWLIVILIGLGVG